MLLMPQKKSVLCFALVCELNVKPCVIIADSCGSWRHFVVGVPHEGVGNGNLIWSTRGVGLMRI